MWDVGCGLWAVGCGFWGVGCGLWMWTVGCRLWAVGCGCRTHPYDSAGTQIMRGHGSVPPLPCTHPPAVGELQPEAPRHVAGQHGLGVTGHAPPGTQAFGEGPGGRIRLWGTQGRGGWGGWVAARSRAQSAGSGAAWGAGPLGWASWAWGHWPCGPRR